MCTWRELIAFHLHNLILQNQDQSNLSDLQHPRTLIESTLSPMLMILSQLAQGIEEDLTSIDPPPFTPNLIKYPQLIKDPAFSWYIPFLAEVSS